MDPKANAAHLTHYPKNVRANLGRDDGTCDTLCGERLDWEQMDDECPTCPVCLQANVTETR
jgi:hypothetical protein